jgi:hypothetical protein
VRPARAPHFTKVCCAVLIVRGDRAQVILSVAHDAPDLPTLDLGMNVVSLFAQ